METETTKLSKCCRARAIADVTPTNSINGDAYSEPIVHYTCLECERDCEAEDVCYYCQGTGEVSRMEAVYPGEPHMADIGTQKCVCQLQDNDEYDDQN